MEDLKVTVPVDTLERSKVEELVDEDLRNFGDWFQQRVGSGPLIRPEIAIIKTYLYFKLFEEKKDGT